MSRDRNWQKTAIPEKGPKPGGPGDAPRKEKKGSDRKDEWRKKRESTVLSENRIGICSGLKRKGKRRIFRGGGEKRIVCKQEGHLPVKDHSHEPPTDGGTEEKKKNRGTRRGGGFLWGWSASATIT